MEIWSFPPEVKQSWHEDDNIDLIEKVRKTGAVLSLQTIVWY
jgi:hypothetical protein